MKMLTAIVMVVSLLLSVDVYSWYSAMSIEVGGLRSVSSFNYETSEYESYIVERVDENTYDVFNRDTAESITYFIETEGIQDE